MRKSLFLLTLFLSFGLLAGSCKKDDEKTPEEKNQEVTDQLIGFWDSTKITQNGTDITSASSATLRFRADKTMDATAEENGAFVAQFGTYEVKDGGTTLSMVLNVSGPVTYKINSVTASTLELQLTLGGTTRVANFAKQ